MTRSRDRISLLPDGLILQLLSLLPFKSAARASSLSRRWRDLWMQFFARAAVLDFVAEGDKQEEFACSINRCLRLHEGKVIKKLNIFFYPGEQHEPDLERWIKFATAKGVEELILDFSGGLQLPPDLDYITGEFADVRKPSRLPCSIFNFGSLIHLSLTLCHIMYPLEFGHLASLQCIYLRQVNIDDDMLKDLLFNCPVLEFLTLRECSDMNTVDVSSPVMALKSLTVIDCCEGSIVIDAPGLRSFHFFGNLCEISPRNISSLGDAFISTFDRLGNEPEYGWSFLSNFTHVEVLTLCSAPLLEFLVTEECNPDQFPMTFPNLRELQLQMELETYLKEIYSFFRLCPCPFLEKLFIEFPVRIGSSDGKKKQKERSPKSEFHHLKTIQMKGFYGHDDQMELIRFLLERAVTLESLVLVTPNKYQSVIAVDAAENSYTTRSAFKDQPLNLLRERLLLMPKISSEAHVVLCGCEEVDIILCAPHTNVRTATSSFYLPETDHQLRADES